jgi:hypothetical protein
MDKILEDQIALAEKAKKTPATAKEDAKNAEKNLEKFMVVESDLKEIISDDNATKVAKKDTRSQG